MMYTTRFKSKVAVLACLLAMALAGMAGAFPSQGGSCTDCHTLPGGAMTISPSPLNVLLGQSGLLSFQNINVAGADTSAIAVEVPSSLYAFLSAGPGGGTWTKRSNANGNSLVSNGFTNATTNYLLDLVVGGGAPAGSYNLEVFLAGTGPVGTRYTLGLNLSTIPEPATLSLLFVGTAAILYRRRRST